MTEIDAIVHRAAESLLAGDFAAGRPSPVAQPIIAGIGTVAPHGVKSPLLHSRLAAAGLTAVDATAFESPAALLASDAWHLALVLSPYKRDIGAACDALTPTAALTGVVDTLVRLDRGTMGVNTNAFAVEAALRQLLAGARPRRVLVAGTGATARSAGVGAKRLDPDVDIGFIGRTRERSEQIVADLGFGRAVEEIGGYAPDLIVNTTTVGEADDRATLAFDLAAAFDPGVRYFDVNNRVSALQTSALATGCLVMSGIVMQVVTNGLRVTLLTR